MSPAAILAPSELLTRSQAAEYLNVAHQTLCLWACTGRHSLPFLKIGRNVRYRKSDLDVWLEARVRTQTQTG